MPPVYSLVNPVHDSEQQLIDAGEALLDQGADASLCWIVWVHRRHRDILRQALWILPVLLSNVLRCPVSFRAQRLVFCVTGQRQDSLYWVVI